MNNKPIFFDASKKRYKISIASLVTSAILIIIAISLFIWTILSAQVPEALQLQFEHAYALPISTQFKNVHQRAVNFKNWLPKNSVHGANHPMIKTAFYTPWDDASYASLTKNIDNIDWLMVAGANINSQNLNANFVQDKKLNALFASRAKNPAKLLMVQNIDNEIWDAPSLKKITSNQKLSEIFINQLITQAQKENYQGIVFDFENLGANDHEDYQKFLGIAQKLLAKAHLISTLTLPVGDANWDMKKYAKLCDKAFLMAYDEHWVGGEAGPIASQEWFVKNIKKYIQEIGADKTIIAIGSYAYDWHGKNNADPLSIEEAWLTAHDNDEKPVFDKISGNSSFAYKEDNQTHQIWLLDAVSAWNEMQAAKVEQPFGIALWRMGSEDPGVWEDFKNIDGGIIPSLKSLSTLGDVDVEGSGEIFQINDVPTIGSRAITPAKNGLIEDETYQSLPTPFVINRKNGTDKQIALTFDDGPDKTWTPQILDILKKEGVNATFFVIGENALPHPALLNRIVNEGNELGNHSYSHPNLAQDSKEGTKIELNTTQRLVEAYTGRSMRLFRAPYFGDAEPTTQDELQPALDAQKLGYINVGLHVDPDDWQRPGVDQIVKTTLDQIAASTPERKAQIVLLHDSGGDRSQTVAALPKIIEALKANGYQLVTVSQLLGISRDAAMPIVKGKDLQAVRFDVGLFASIAFLQNALKDLFYIAIGLGIVKSISLTILAVRQKFANQHIIPPEYNQEIPISVLIPAYNEEKVIKDAIERVLSTQYANFEILVVNDGSKDATSQIVKDNFADNSKVKLLDLTNRGKAGALNEALKHVTGEIIVALDADTQFEPDTIAKLVRWFKDEKIGAVAGNARVGNEINLVTRWQAIEYIVSQNIERRALANFDAITVVPGAVGAWRKKALEEVGNYPEDTLAEDQDLTIAIQKIGWKVIYDEDAIAWTEAPESFAALAKQRFRWSFGTLQCLWKHRDLLLQKNKNARGLSLIGIPQAWVFQIFFALISPLIDLALVLSMASTAQKIYQHGIDATQSDLLKIGIYWLCFMTIDLGCGFIAYSLESRKTKFRPFLMAMQRFLYRQIMYWVCIKAIFTAITGLWTGWGKLERSGKVNINANAQ